jgi:hypothetical protein
LGSVVPGQQFKALQLRRQKDERLGVGVEKAPLAGEQVPAQPRLEVDHGALGRVCALKHFGGVHRALRVPV